MSATDKDGSNIVYTGISGDATMRDSLEIDALTGEITITDNKHLDRETKDSKILFLLSIIKIILFCSVCDDC